MDSTFESANRVYGVNGVAPTMNTCGGGGLQPKILEVKKLDVEQLGHIEKGTGSHQSNIVYDENGLSPCICAGIGVKQQPTMILDKQIVAMRGRETACLSQKRTEYGKEIRKAYENHEIEEQRKNMQQLEPRTDGLTNTITTVQKDNLVLEIKQGINPKYHDFIYEIDGEFYLIRIRKLMPIECWRLMNFTDHDFNKAQEVVSNSQLYKSAGNSIVVSVLMAIFSQLNISGVKPWNEMTDDERYNLIYKE